MKFLVYYDNNTHLCSFYKIFIVIIVFWGVKPCSLEVKSFAGNFYLHDTTFQKRSNFVGTAVKCKTIFLLIIDTL